MWARIIELMLSFWLALSPFIFKYSAENTFLWRNDLGCGSFVALVSLLSFWSRAEKMHLLILPTGLWLVVNAFIQSPSSANENHLIIGLLLAMLSLVPSHAESPPRQWVEFLNKKR